MEIREETRSEALKELCIHVKELVSHGEYDACDTMICEAMEYYPNAPQPHNLLGIVMEKQGNHVGAMKHFRAAWALDPSYSPSCQNLTRYGTFYSGGKDAFDESDCPPDNHVPCEIQYDAKGIGHIMRRN